MGYLEDFILVQKMTLRDMRASFLYLPILVFAGVFITLFHNVALTLLQQWPGFAPLAGVFLVLIRLVELASFLTALQLAVRADKIRRFPAYKFSQLLGQVLELGLIFYLAQALILRFVPGSTYLILGLVFLLFHALPESIYLSEQRGLEAVRNALVFLRENLLNFGLPSLASLLLLYFLFNERVLQDDLLDLGLYFLEWITIGILAIYRGHLYLNLYGSNRRKRAFMKHFD